MGRSRRRTLGQHVAYGATMGLPAPIRDAVGSRWGSRIFLVILGILFAAGVVNVEWRDGWPTLNFNRHRAEEVGKTVVDEWRTYDETRRAQDPESRYSRESDAANAERKKRFPWLR